MTEPIKSMPQYPMSRFRPDVGAGSLCLIAYIAVFYGIAQASGIAYPDWFANATNASHSALIPLVAGSALLLLFMGWSKWNALWRDPFRLPTNRLHASLMLLFVATILLRLVFIRWRAVPMDLLLVVISVGIGVGFAEEMALRGVFLRGARTSGRSEGQAVLLTSIAFGLIHIPNIFLGVGVIGVAQLFLAAITGFVLYLFRRRFAWIVPAMIAHGMWDVSLFLSKDNLPEEIATASLILTGLIQVLALFALILFVRSETKPVDLRV